MMRYDHSPMKTALPLLLALLVSCASSDGFVDKRVNQCGPGQPVEMQVGLQGGSNRSERMDDRLTLMVEVANNSADELTVKYIRVDPMAMDAQAGAYELQNAYKEVGETIASGDDQLFEIPVTGRMRTLDMQNRQRVSGAVDLAVTVGLEDGSSYRCRFRVAAPF